MGVDHHGPTDLYEDNQSCILICMKEGISERTKHIEVKYFFTRDCIHDGTIALKKIKTDLQPADLATKALPKDAHQRHAKTLVGQAHSAHAESQQIHIPICSAMRNAKPRTWANSTAVHQQLLSLM